MRKNYAIDYWAQMREIKDYDTVLLSARRGTFWHRGLQTASLLNYISLIAPHTQVLWDYDPIHSANAWMFYSLPARNQMLYEMQMIQQAHIATNAGVILRSRPIFKAKCLQDPKLVRMYYKSTEWDVESIIEKCKAHVGENASSLNMRFSHRSLKDYMRCLLTLFVKQLSCPIYMEVSKQTPLDIIPDEYGAQFVVKGPDDPVIATVLRAAESRPVVCYVNLNSTTDIRYVTDYSDADRARLLDLLNMFDARGIKWVRTGLQKIHIHREIDKLRALQTTKQK